MKEELLDDIIKQSAPYEAPGEGQGSVGICVLMYIYVERMQTRAEMSAAQASTTAHTEDMIQPNE